MVEFLSQALVMAIHEDQVALYGGKPGVRDRGAFEGALHMPQAQFGGAYLHATPLEMAAAYGFYLSQDHPFFDGNKRTAGMVMFTFLELNGLTPRASEDEYYQLMMGVASSKVTKEQVMEWLQTVGVETNAEPSA